MKIGMHYEKRNNKYETEFSLQNWSNFVMKILMTKLCHFWNYYKKVQCFKSSRSSNSILNFYVEFTHPVFSPSRWLCTPPNVQITLRQLTGLFLILNHTIFFCRPQFLRRRSSLYPNEIWKFKQAQRCKRSLYPFHMRYRYQ